MKIKLKIIFSYLICHLISYFILSVPYYHFVMKKYYVGDKAVFQSFLITENQQELWSQVLTYIVPIQILNAVLFATLILLIFDWFRSQTILKSFFFLFWSKTIINGLLSISPGPGTLEGILFLLPSVTMKIHFLVFMEMVFQGLIVAALFIFINRRFWRKTIEHY
jgi:hypothetical protein